MPDTTSSDARVLSHNTIRRAVGIVGLATPLGLFLYGLGGQMQPSISHFYFTEAGDVFVGALCAIAIFLITYRGYPEEFPSKDWFFGDRFASILAAIGAIGVAVFPTSIKNGFVLCQTGGAVTRCDLPSGDVLDQLLTPIADKPGLLEISADLVTGIPGPQIGLHAASTALFLLPLVYFCLVLFPLGPKGDPDRRTELRTYYACGILMLICLALFAATALGWINLGTYSVFVYETLAIWAFSIAWLVNGEIMAQLHVPGFRQAKYEG